MVTDELANIENILVVEVWLDMNIMKELTSLSTILVIKVKRVSEFLENTRIELIVPPLILINYGLYFPNNQEKNI